MIAVAPGNTSIKVSCGPCCHSMEDLTLFVKLLLTHPSLPYEPTAMPGYWGEPALLARKLRVGVMTSDGVVDPHPPVQRALRESALELQAAGHEMVDFTPPFDCWEAALTTWALYFQTGAKEHRDMIAAAEEPPISQFAYNADVFKTRELTVPELLNHNVKQAGFKAAFAEAWTALQLDCVICPCAPMAGVPHDFAVWWVSTLTRDYK